VAERVARHAAVPVLVAHPGHEQLERVILGIDGSPAADHAASWLSRFPLPPECEVRVFTALPSAGVGPVTLPTDQPPYLLTLDRLRDLGRVEARERLERTAGLLGQAGLRATTELRDAEPATGLLQAATDEGADLIVVGSLGHSAVERFFLGSVSERVLRHAPCSVLIVR
jgi:nucleotide-binding universal stress UspA family protein